MFSVVNHVLHKDGKPVPQKPSPNHGGAMKPAILVLHYTASSTAAGAIATLTDGHASNRVSAHLVLDKDGSVTQLLPFNVVGWHVGKSAWEGRAGCNDFAIGIEQVNAGVLNHMADGSFRTQLGKQVVPGSDVLHAQHRITHGWAYWEDYPDAQVQAALAMIASACHRWSPASRRWSRLEPAFTPRGPRAARASCRRSRPWLSLLLADQSSTRVWIVQMS